MVITPKQTTLAYRCPHCGTGVISGVGMFSLTADRVKLKCPCGRSELEVVYTNDKKVRLTVPCMLCPSPHHFTVSQNIFYGKDVFTLPCPYTDINICFMGEMNHVKAALAQTELELLDLMEKSGISDYDALHREQEELLPDPQIQQIVLFVISELKEEKKIFCNCPDKTGGNYDCRIMDDGILVFCEKCGASHIVPVDSFLGAQAFLDCDSLYLQ